MKTKANIDQIKGVIFDVDGTLLDSMSIWANIGERYLRRAGIVPEPNLGEKLFTMSLNDGAHYLKTAYKLRDSEEVIKQSVLGIVEDFYIKEAPLKAGVKELVIMFREHQIPMVLATSSSRHLVEAALRRLGIWNCFERMFTCDEVGVGKKDSPLIYQQAADSLHLSPAETFVFEDALHAIYTAHEAGFITVGVFDETSKKDQEAIRSFCDYYLDRIDELI